MDRQSVSFMYSYPNSIPLQPAEVRAMHQRLDRLDYADVYGFSWGRNIIGSGRTAVDASVARFLQAMKD